MGLKDSILEKSTVMTDAIQWSRGGFIAIVHGFRGAKIGIWQDSSFVKLRDIDCSTMGHINSMVVSPNGNEIALATESRNRNNPNIWLLNPVTGIRSPLSYVTQSKTEKK
jgi:hypothetical protein